MNKIYLYQQQNILGYNFLYTLIYFVTTVYGINYLFAVINDNVSDVMSFQEIFEYFFLRIVISIICCYKNNSPLTFDNVFDILAETTEITETEVKEFDSDYRMKLMRAVEIFYQSVFTITLVSFMFGYNLHFFELETRVMMYTYGFLFAGIVTFLHALYSYIKVT
ncbi:MAG: hypothetical protein Terrestrivirus4_107 [Terrestrivirus sp.]|uniref:Uncharacterized protein n=1 Tax=Terrestrivirus sp. TaxID=2487775 RepID=A0A3G4ZRL0_9VIRU|nr:MAG: hypothetical protein Terrestrivirus4_107 [Terrestrivirus sp.]